MVVGNGRAGELGDLVAIVVAASFEDTVAFGTVIGVGIEII